jgi:voltage-gated potassium channel
LCNDSHKIFLEYYEKTRYLSIPFRLRTALRLVFAQKIAYMLTPLALIDLLAIVSIYRPLQILRVFLIFRLLKLFRYFNNIKLFADVLASKRFELYTLAIFLGFLIFTVTIANKSAAYSTRFISPLSPLPPSVLVIYHRKQAADG